MELRLNREKITGQKQTTTGTATKRKLILGTPSAAQGVGGNQKPDTAPAVSDLETATISAGRANFSGDRGGTAMGKGFGTTPSLAQRVGDTLSGAGKQYVSSLGGALTGLYSMGTATREKENQQEQAEIQRRLKLMDEGWKQQLAAGKVTARDKAEYEQAVKAQQDRLNVLKEVQRAQRGTTGASLGAMEELEQSAQRDVDRAKEGLGGVGRFVVDTGVAGSQMLMDATLGGGSAMLPMAGRVFGGGYQEATREGATNGEALAYGAGSAAVSVLTEKLANVAAPFKKIYGGGWLDEAIGKTAGKMNTTAAGRLALSALSEAGEEFLEAAAQPVLQRATYDKNARFDLGEALYSALVGAALGGAGGAVEVIGGRGTPSVTADGGDSSPARGEPSAPEVQQDTAGGDEVQNGQDVQARPQTTAQPAQGAAEPENLTFQQEVARQLQGQEQPKTAQTGAENIQTIGGMTDEAAENGRPDTQQPGGNQVRTGISGGDVQRTDGARAGGEAGVLAESTERARERAAEQQRAAGERQNYAKALRLNPVSSKELGLASGTDARVTRVLPAEHWDDAMRQTAQRVKRETGKDVTYVVGAIQVRDQSGNVHRVRGVFSDTGIILQSDNLRYTIDQIADHETYHDKAARSPELNQRIRERITQKFNADEFSAILDKYIQGQRGLLDLSEDASEAEMKAFEDAVMEEIFADAYAGMNAFGSHAEKFQGTVEQVMIEQGVGRSRETARASDRTTGPPERFSYAGRGALRSNQAQQEEAERMEMQGIDSETIRRQTGWFRGADRQWRWEIDDSGMEYDKDGNVEGAVTRQWAMEDVDNAWADMVDAITPEQLERVREYLRATLDHNWELADRLYQPLAKELGQPFTSWVEAREWAMQNRDKSTGGKLSDYIQHPELFANYPQLRNVKLRFEPMADANGYYSPSTDEIVINEAIKEHGEETLIHEVQHVIQHIEGFATGANPEYWKQVQEGDNPVRSNDRKIAEARARIEQTLSALPEDVAEQFRQFTQTEKTDEAAAVDMAEQLGEGPYGEQFNQYFMDTWALEELEKYNHRRGANDLYRSTAGEIEARDTASRLRHSKEGREWLAPYTGDENTVFADRETDSEDYIPGDISTEETQAGIRAVAGMEPVAAITGAEFQKGEKDLTTQAAEFFDSIGNQVFNPQLGDVTLDRRGAKDDIAHGIGRKKAAAFAAVPDVLEKGRVIDFQKDWKGRGYDTAVVAAPITIGGVKHYAGVVLLRSRDTNRFYVHEVLTTENGASPFKTGASSKRGLPGGDAPSVISLLRQVRDVNTEDAGTPEGLSLPRPEPTSGSKKQYSVSQPEGLTLPGAESENKPASAVEALPAKAQNYLKGPEWISLPKLEKFSMEDEGEQITIQKWTRERAIEEELARRGAEDYQQLLLRKGGVKALNENDRAMKKLQKQLDKLNGKRPKKMTRPSDKPPQKSLPTIAKQDLKQNLLNLFSIPEGQRTELGAVIDHYAEQMLKEGSLTQQTRDRFFDRMYAAGVVTVQADPYYQAGRGAVAGGRVYVNKQIRGDFGEDWNDFRKRAFAAGVYLTSDKTHAGVDVWNQELSEILPGMFDADELDGRTVLERIVQAAEEGKDEKMSLADYAAMLDREGKYEKMSLADHTAMLAQQERVTADQLLDGIERQMDWALRTFAEKAKLEIRLRDRTGIKLAQMRADHKEAAERQRADRELRELQQKTLKQLQWLSKNRNRAPAEVKAAWDEVLGDIDLFAVGAANEMNWSEKYNATWRDLAQMYKDAQKNDPNFLPSKELERIVSRLDNKKIGDMDVDALQDLYRAAIGLRQEFYNRNNVLGDMEHRMFEEIFDDAKKELEGQSGRYSGKAWDRLFNLEQLTPLNVMQRMAGWNPKSTWFSMAKQIEKGERDVRGYTVEANRYLEQFLTEHEDWVKKADGQGKDAIWYELEVPELVELQMGDKPIFGDTIKVYMTPAQKVHMYLESKSEDNLRHMVGGRCFVTEKTKSLYGEGKRTEALRQDKHGRIKLAPETVKEIVSDLTAEERELARLLENYYNDFAKSRINRVSNILYGYDKAISRNYAPIYTNDDFTKSEIGIFNATAEGVGNLKPRQYSKNPSLNMSAFDAFERHVDQTARFVGMAIPARNWQTLLNWQTKNDSMGSVIANKWGVEATKYITSLLEDLQGGKVLERDTISSTIDKTFSKYISAVFGANPSIVLKQLGSIPLASAYLDMKNVPSVAQLRSIDRGLIGKYTQELDYRTMGYSMPETKILKENPGRMQSNKFLNFTFGGGAITAMDGWAASTLWPWAENKVRRDFPELEVGTQEQIETGKSPFYQKVAELFNEAVTHTQSVSDITHQSTLRKSRNPITRAFTMFKSDSAQGYNVLRQKIGEAQYYKKSGADAETVRKAQRDAGGAFLSIVAGYSYAQVITFLINLWKQKGKKYKDDEGELSAGSVLQEMAFGVAGDVAGMVVLGQELAEIIGNILTGETWYGIDTPGNEQLNDLLETVVDSFKGVGEFVSDMASIVSKGGSPVEYIRRHGNDYLGGIKDAAAAAATYLPGLPVNNLEAYLLGLVRWVSPELATAYDDLMATATKSGLSGLKGDALTIRVRNLLENRAGDVSAETAKTLAALYEAGYKQAAPTDTPGSITVGEEDNKQTLKLDAYQQQLYDMVWQAAIGGALDELAASDAFLDADAETQADMAEKLYEYAREKGRAAVTDEYEMSSTAQKADEIIGAGATAAQWAALAATMSGAKSAEKYRLIADSDLSEEAMVAAIGTVMGTEMKTDSGSPSQYAKMLDALESGIGVDEYLDLHEAGVVDQYLENVEAGVNPDTAAEIVLRIADIKGAAKAAEEDLSDLELYRAAVDVTDGESEQLAVLQSLMTDSEYAKLTAGHDAGVTPEQYVQVRETIAEIDDNGNTSQAEATQAIARMSGLTVNQKAALWQIQNKSWSAKNNPFSPGVGAKVKRAMEEDAASDAPAWISLPKPGE